VGELIFDDCTTTWFPRALEQVRSRIHLYRDGFHMNAICPGKIVPFLFRLSREGL